MNLCRLLPRLWLACHALVWLALTGAVKAEEKVIERRPLADGAEVVVVQVSDQTAAHVSLRHRKPDGSEREFYQTQGKLKQVIQCREKRMSLSLARWTKDTVIVTLDMNPEEPRLYEDRFCNRWGDQFIRVKLLSADEVDLYYAFDLSCKQRHLLRNEAGRLISQGLPYRESVLLSSVAVFSPEYQQVNSYTLPPAPEKELPGFAVMSRPIGASAPVLYQIQLERRLPFPLCDFWGMPDVYQRLQDMHAAFSHFKRQPVVSATVAGGPELLLPRLDEMAFSPSSDSYGMTGWDTRYLFYDYWPWLRFFDSGKFCLALGELGLPCFNTYYDHIVAGMRETYGIQYHYSTKLLALSVPSSDELVLSELFLHELKMAGL